MTIKQQGGVFGRNPTFHSVETDGGDVLLDNSTGTSPLLWDADQATLFIGPQSGSVKNGNTRLRLQSTNAAYMELVSTTTTATGVLMGDTDDSFRGGIVYDNNVDELRLWAGNASRVVVNSTGNLVMNSGNGIDFSATSGTGTSELFSDYEEGTFSPVFADAISGGNLASTSNTYAQYTKVGNVVHCTISMLNINTTGLTAGNTAYIQGLPFATVSAGTSRFFPIYVRADGITSTVGIQGWILANAVTYIGLENVTTTGKANLLVSAISSGVSDLAVSFSYFTS